MEWNWQQADWPNFSFAEPRLAQAEERFLLGSGVIFGAASHLRRDDHERLTVEFLGSEALTTSEIEGEILNRESVTVVDSAGALDWGPIAAAVVPRRRGSRK